MDAQVVYNRIRSHAPVAAPIRKNNPRKVRTAQSALRKLTPEQLAKLAEVLR